MVEEKKEGNNSMLMFGAIALLGILIIAAGFYWLAPQDNAGNTGGQEEEIKENPLDNANAKLMLGAADKKDALIAKDYSVTYDEKLAGGETGNITFIKEGESKYLVVGQRFSKKKIFWQANESVICETSFEGVQKCAKVEDNETLENYTSAALGIFFAYDNQSKQENEELISSKAIKFVGEPVVESVAKRPCHCIVYDYSTYRLERCFDDEYGIVMKRKEYLKSAPDMAYKFEITEFTTAPTEQIQYPAEFSTEDEVEALLDSMQAVEEEVFYCESMGAEGNYDQCIMMAAIDNDKITLCDIASNQSMKEECTLRFLLRKGEYAKCELTGSLKNECYTNAAYATEDESYCNSIALDEDRQVCLAAISTKKEEAAVAQAAQEAAQKEAQAVEGQNETAQNATSQE